MVYLVTSSHVCSSISSITVVINNDLKLPVIILHFKMQVEHFHSSLGNI